MNLIELAYAACPQPIDLITKIKAQIVTPIIGLLFTAAVVYFLYGVFEMIRGADSDEARQTGRQHIIWGVIGMFIMVSAFGLINLIYVTFHIQTCP